MKQFNNETMNQCDNENFRNYSIETLKNWKIESRGFTLIEVMVVMVIVGILGGIGLARYIDFNKTQTLKQAGQNLKNDLRQAQNMALSSQKDCSGTLDGYKFDFASAGTTYNYYSSCSPGPAYGVSNIVSLPTGITFSNSGSLFFKTLGQGVNSAVTICLSGFNNLYKLVISLSGEIQDYGIVGSCP